MKTKTLALSLGLFTTLMLTAFSSQAGNDHNYVSCLSLSDTNDIKLNKTQVGGFNLTELIGSNQLLLTWSQNKVRLQASEYTNRKLGFSEDGKQMIAEIGNNKSEKISLVAEAEGPAFPRLKLDGSKVNVAAVYKGVVTTSKGSKARVRCVTTFRDQIPGGGVGPGMGGNN